MRHLSWQTMSVTWQCLGFTTSVGSCRPSSLKNNTAWKETKRRLLDWYYIPMKSLAKFEEINQNNRLRWIYRWYSVIQVRTWAIGRVTWPGCWEKEADFKKPRWWNLSILRLLLRHLFCCWMILNCWPNYSLWTNDDKWEALKCPQETFRPSVP